jgi:ferredoxin--NADP+ reductase
VWQRFRRVIVVHGVRDTAQLAYQVELGAWRAERPVAVVTCPSRASVNPPMLSGRVTQALVDGRLEEAAGTSLSPERSHVMLCGNPEMVAEMSALLHERGLSKHRQRKPGHITVEKYW